MKINFLPAKCFVLVIIAQVIFLLLFLPPALSTPTPPATCPDGMVAYWRADGDATDCINSNDGTLIGDATFEPGISGQAFSFGKYGGDDYVDCGNGSTLQIGGTGKSFSLEAWVKRLSSSPDTLDMVIGHGICSLNKGLHFGYRTNGIFTLAFYENDLDTSDSYPDVGEWHHWVGTYDGTTNERKLYRDGILVAEDVSPGDYVGSGFLRIGSRGYQLTPDYFHGLIDEVAVYNRVLPPDVILKHYWSAQQYCDIPRVVGNLVASGDYNGDGSADIGIFRTDNGLWAIRQVSRCYFGSSNDLPASGDYDGDGTSDIAIYRNTTGLWAIKDISRFYFGAYSDIPMPRDYNGDNTCDAGIFRPSNGLWAIRGITRIHYGSVGDFPVTGDYNCDGRVEVGIFRNSTGLWAVRGGPRITFGISGDYPFVGNFLGDRTLDIGLFRTDSALWLIRDITQAYFGAPYDLPVPAAYSGNNELGIFRESSGLWAIRGSTRFYFGTEGDLPVTR